MDKNTLIVIGFIIFLWIGIYFMNKDTNNKFKKFNGGEDDFKNR